MIAARMQDWMSVHLGSLGESKAGTALSGKIEDGVENFNLIGDSFATQPQRITKRQEKPVHHLIRYGIVVAFGRASSARRRNNLLGLVTCSLSPKRLRARAHLPCLTDGFQTTRYVLQTTSVRNTMSIYSAR